MRSVRNTGIMVHEVSKKKPGIMVYEVLHEVSQIHGSPWCLRSVRYTGDMVYEVSQIRERPWCVRSVSDMEEWRNPRDRRAASVL